MSAPRAGLNGRDNPDELDTRELLALYKQTGDESLKWPLVLRYEGLIRSVALQVRGVYCNFAQVEDIINEGILTLLRAIDKFDPDKGVKFETYVSKRIRGMVVDLARKQDWMPRNVRQRGREIEAAVNELSARLGRYPTEGEIAEQLGVSVERYQKDAASVALSHVLSLEALMDARETEGSQFEPISTDERSQPEAALQDQELRLMLSRSIEGLRPNEQIVLSLYYEKNLHLKEIAQVMELSEARISQIHSRAIQKLRIHMEAYIRGSGQPPQPRGKKKG